MAHEIGLFRDPFNKMTGCRDSHYKGKMVVRQYYFHGEYCCTVRPHLHIETVPWYEIWMFMITNVSSINHCAFVLLPKFPMTPTFISDFNAAYFPWGLLPIVLQVGDVKTWNDIAQNKTMVFVTNAKPGIVLSLNILIVHVILPTVEWFTLWHMAMMGRHPEIHVFLDRIVMSNKYWVHVDGLKQERCNSIASELALSFSWTNPSM